MIDRNCSEMDEMNTRHKNENSESGERDSDGGDQESQDQSILTNTEDMRDNLGVHIGKEGQNSTDKKRRFALRNRRLR